MNTEKNFAEDCARLVARTALDVAETMSTDQRLMIQRGIMELFPVGSPEWNSAKATSDALIEFKTHQLNLFRSLDA